MVVDRIEGDRAVLEIDGRMVDVPLGLLPEGATEGSVLQFGLTGPAAAEVTDEAAARLARLRARTPQGPGTFEL